MNRAPLTFRQEARLAPMGAQRIPAEAPAVCGIPVACTIRNLKQCCPLSRLVLRAGLSRCPVFLFKSFLIHSQLIPQDECNFKSFNW